jgi:hypothetical protein
MNSIDYYILSVTEHLSFSCESPVIVWMLKWTDGWNPVYCAGVQKSNTVIHYIYIPINKLDFHAGSVNCASMYLGPNTIPPLTVISKIHLPNTITTYSLFLNNPMIDLRKSEMKSKRLWKESLNSDGQQFNQYQRNEQLPLAFTQINYFNTDPK